MWLQVINKVKVTHQGEGHIKVKVKISSNFMQNFTYFNILILCIWPKVINKVKVTHQGEGHIKVKVKYLHSFKFYLTRTLCKRVVSIRLKCYLFVNALMLGFLAGYRPPSYQLYPFLNLHVPQGQRLPCMVKSLRYTSYWNASLLIVTVCKRSWGKVMFSQACVKNSVHKGGVYTP